ncbi:DUF6542 domain-containing protein [Streptomyces pathocidini]
MEQPSRNTPQAGPRRAPGQVPEQESATVYRAAPRRSTPPAVVVLRRLRKLQQVPGPRLTGLGCGLLSMLAMLTTGVLDDLLLDGSSVVYGLVFLVVCVGGGLWVRPNDLITAPISAPIAFTVGLQPISGGEGGFGPQVIAVFTQLALQAGWLYAGTATACLVVALRKVLVLSDRAAARRRGASGGVADRG